MELLSTLAVIGGLGAAVYAAYRMADRSQSRPRPPRPLSAAEMRQREQRHRLNQKARVLQLALLRLTEAPDFRRAASWAAQAQDVPRAFRQRQFRRFRARIVRHFTSRLSAGADPEALSQSLSILLQHLGIATFEAEYIRAEAERALPPPRAPAQTSYGHAIAQLQREHAQRLETLRTLAGLDNETREQLLEAERTRFREALERLNQQEMPAGG